MGDSVNLETVLKIIRNNATSIIVLTLVFGGIMALITFVILSPRYEAKTQILISQPESSEAVDDQDVETSLQLINTYRDIILSPAILSDVVSNLALEQSMTGLSRRISVGNEDQSQVITVTVTGESTEEAVLIADEIAGVFQEQVTDIMNVDNVSVLSSAHLEADTNPVSPDPVINITVGMVFGLLLGLTVAFSRAFFDKSMKTEEDVQKYINIPVIGSIEKFKNE